MAGDDDDRVMADAGAEEPSARVLDELLAAFGAGPTSPMGQESTRVMSATEQSGAPPIVPPPPATATAAPPHEADALVPEPTRRSQRRSRREAKREAKRAAKRAAALEKEGKRKAEQAGADGIGSASGRPRGEPEVDALATESAGEDLGVRIIPASTAEGKPVDAHPSADATAASESAVAHAVGGDVDDEAPAPTVRIDDYLPDILNVAGELEGPEAPEADADGGARSTVFIDDRGPGTGEVVAVDVATTAARMEPRLRERRIAVKRAVGRKRLKWAAVASVVVGVVVAALAVLGSGWFSISTIDVEGAVYSQGAALDTVVQDLEGANVLRVDTEEAERQLERIPWIADARVTTDFPHGATIEIRERRPIVAYQATDGAYRVLDGDGRVLDVVAGQPVDYIELDVVDGPSLDPGETAPAGYRAAASLISALTPQMRQRTTSVAVDQNATDLSLVLDDQIEVRFGAADELLDKLVRLQTALTNPNPALTATELIDVSTDDVIVR